MNAPSDNTQSLTARTQRSAADLTVRPSPDAQTSSTMICELWQPQPLPMSIEGADCLELGTARIDWPETREFARCIAAALASHFGMAASTFRQSIIFRWSNGGADGQRMAKTGLRVSAPAGSQHVKQMRDFYLTELHPRWDDVLAKTVNKPRQAQLEFDALEELGAAVGVDEATSSPVIQGDFSEAPVPVVDPGESARQVLASELVRGLAGKALNVTVSPGPGDPAQDLPVRQFIATRQSRSDKGGPETRTGRINSLSKAPARIELIVQDSSAPAKGVKIDVTYQHTTQLVEKLAKCWPHEADRLFIFELERFEEDHASGHRTRYELRDVHLNEAIRLMSWNTSIESTTMATNDAAALDATQAA